MKRRYLLQQWICVGIFIGISSACAVPFIEADNRWLRSDVQALAEAGVITSPVTQWPIMWASVGDDLEKADSETMATSLLSSFERVRKAYERASSNKIQGYSAIEVASDAAIFREFGDSSREKATFDAALDWVGDNAAIRLQVQAVKDPIDGENVTANGSYLGLVKGNWVFSAGVIDRWWGPGWKNSMILSTNARSFPALSIQRHYTQPFESPWLSFIGPWTLETFMGKLEKDRHIPNALLWGLRATFKPVPALEVGLSRTAIWGGTGRSNSLNAFGHILLGTNENGGNGLTAVNDPSNQQAGFDMKWQLTTSEVPLNAYMQYIGDDKLINGVPSKAIVLYGLEAGQFHTNWGNYRLFAEYANTTPSGFQGIRTNNTTYEHSIYQSGYRYRGRSIGATFDNDSVVTTLGFIGSNYQNQELSMNYSVMNLNRDGTDKSAPGGNSITKTALKLNALETRYRYYWKQSYIELEASIYDENVLAFALDTSNRLSLGYHYEF